MDESFAPHSEAEVLDLVRHAANDKRPLIVQGAGTKRGWGRPIAGDVLDLSQLSGITLYEPEELVLSAQAATPLAEIERRLAQRGQRLAFEPPDLGPLYGVPKDKGTLGGAVACNLAGPRRISAGAARDHVLGFAGVSGRGEAFKSGGRVVKNVTGFDLSKLLAGSFGTLAVMTSLTLKVLPASEMTATVLLTGLDTEAAVAAMSKALNSPHEVSGAAHLPHVQPSLTALRLEGTSVSVAARVDGLKALLGATDLLDTTASVRFWSEVRDVAPLLDDPERAVWQVSIPPASGATVAAAIRARLDARHYFDWGGGRLWLAVAGDVAEGATVIRTAVAASGGHASLMRAADGARRRVAPFQPLPPAEAALVKRLKDNFDPAGILNPSRMYEGV
jgi:glycolate oxidase FAD binding subunit